MGCTLCKYFNLQVKQLLSSAPSTFTNRFSSKKPIWLEIYALLCEKLFSGYFIPFIFICSCYILSRYKYIIITQEHMKQHGRWHLHVSMCSDQLGILKPCGVLLLASISSQNSNISCKEVSYTITAMYYFYPEIWAVIKLLSHMESKISGICLKQCFKTRTG